MSNIYNSTLCGGVFMNKFATLALIVSLMSAGSAVAANSIGTKMKKAAVRLAKWPSAVKVYAKKDGRVVNDTDTGKPYEVNFSEAHPTLSPIIATGKFVAPALLVVALTYFANKKTRAKKVEEAVKF